jgi:3-isopropylmalate/(R)-2-methylmalate dehydratase large subunit
MSLSSTRGQTPTIPLSLGILAAHGATDLTPGAFAQVRCDLVMMNDVSGSLAMRAFERIGAQAVFDSSRIVLVADHFVPPKDIRSAELVADLRRFAQAHAIDHYYELGRTAEAGIEHTLLAELGLVRPGALIAGGDSHTCTYGAWGALGLGLGSTDIASALALGEVWVRIPETVRVDYVGLPGPWTAGKDLILALLREIGSSGAVYAALEFSGPVIDGLGVDDRMSLCNMSIETGAKSGICHPNDAVLNWLAERVDVPLDPMPAAGPAAVHDRVFRVDVADLPPLVARPPDPGAVCAVDELPGGLRVDQVYVGNCSNGTLSDIRQLIAGLGGDRVARGTRLMVVPATSSIFAAALAEGLVETLTQAGAVIVPPTCGACFGGHMGILGPGERALATTNRNFRGRMGHTDSEVYLANAYVAGASAAAGEIADPRAR